MDILRARRRELLKQKNGARFLLLMHFNNSVADECGNTVTAGTGSYAPVYREAGKFGACASLACRFATTKIAGIENATDLTIDFWYRFRVNYVYQGGRLLEPNVYNSNLAYIDHANGYMRILQGSDIVVSSSQRTDFMDCLWHHIAFVQKNGIVTVYIDGVADGSNALPPNWSGTDDYVFSKQNASQERYDIDEFCIRAGAVWEGNFTPPTAPYEI